MEPVKFEHWEDDLYAATPDGVYDGDMAGMYYPATPVDALVTAAKYVCDSLNRGGLIDLQACDVALKKALALFE